MMPTILAISLCSAFSFAAIASLLERLSASSWSSMDGTALAAASKPLELEEDEPMVVTPVSVSSILSGVSGTYVMDDRFGVGTWSLAFLLLDAVLGLILILLPLESRGKTVLLLVVVWLFLFPGWRRLLLFLSSAFVSRMILVYFLILL